MNIQRINSAHHFRMQSEREQTLVQLFPNCTQIRAIIGRAKRAPHWDVQSRFRVICICYSTGRSDIRDIFHEVGIAAVKSL